MPTLKHAVINSLARDELQGRRQIEAEIIPDTFDFGQPKWKLEEHNMDFLERNGVDRGDIVLLQATRIVERKNIEVAMDLVHLLSIECFLGRLRGKTLYNGKHTTANSRVVLVLAGYAELDSMGYLERLKSKAGLLGIEVRFVGDQIKAQRALDGERKYYSLWDAYAHADAVTYPSVLEGWGNQFIEAIFAEKPIVLFKYPVFEKDIKPRGYRFVSFGNRMLRSDATGLGEIPKEVLGKAAGALVSKLTGLDALHDARHNIDIAKRNNSLEELKTIMARLLPIAG